MTEVAVRNSSLYDEDFVLWTKEQARLLRQGRFDELDLHNLIDEVESAGSSERREIRNRLSILLAHLLKWKYQPGARSPSWRNTIDAQRQELLAIVEDSPSLGRYPGEIFRKVYLSGRAQAARETGIDFTLFPECPPFTAEQAMDSNFLPKEPDLYDLS